MRSNWKVFKKYLRSFSNFKNTMNFKRSELIPKVSHLGAKVSVYNGRYPAQLTVHPFMEGQAFRFYVPSTVYGFRVQQKWSLKKEKQKGKLKK